MDRPVRFEPFLRPMVWGGRRLGDVLGKPLPTAESYGESWELSDHASHRSVVASGPHAGRTLRSLMERDRGALLGAAAETHVAFPWLVKFLDAGDWLSVQVHPDENVVRTLWPGEGSKTEAWFVLAAEPGSRIYAGLKPGVDATTLRHAVADGSVTEHLHSFAPRPGDCVFLPAGTVHAVGGGVLIAEIQQTSDATFRLFDWNRRDAAGKSRQLHIEEGFASIHWDRGPVESIRVEGFADRGAVNPRRQRLVRCPYFEIDYVESDRGLGLETGRLRVLVMLAGGSRLTFPGGAERAVAGQTWLLPATLPELRLEPEAGLKALVCTLP